MREFKGTDVVNIKDFSIEEIEHILGVAETMVPIADGSAGSKLLASKILATLFFEPSTRTRLSFETAMHRLGGRVIGFAEPGSTSASKGETLADTIKMAEAYADVIVLRHPYEGAARLAAKFSSKPVINAGDGAGQHPTQTMLDLFTIKMARKRISGLNIVLVGDLKYGRTVHSLAHALALFGANLILVSPPTLQMPKEVIDSIKRVGTVPSVSETLEKVVPLADVLYVTRIQRERFPDAEEYKKVVGSYRIDMKTVEDAKKDMVILHPLPRVNEIAPEIDETPHALYFKQAFNGVPVRMALLSLVLGTV